MKECEKCFWERENYTPFKIPEGKKGKWHLQREIWEAQCSQNRAWKRCLNDRRCRWAQIPTENPGTCFSGLFPLKAGGHNREVTAHSCSLPAHLPAPAGLIHPYHNRASPRWSLWNRVLVSFHWWGLIRIKMTQQAMLKHGGFCLKR